MKNMNDKAKLKFKKKNTKRLITIEKRSVRYEHSIGERRMDNLVNALKRNLKLKK